ncbi:MAG: PDGLE domain-containing protein [Candidatus Heimdallarchaeota archaeon]|nr:MAG: PDGLE domain-containing protein [Candidatus Heimdallarchaeota archaeon]
MEVKKKLTVGIMVILVLFLLLTPFADSNPDGLESAAGEYVQEGGSFDLGILSDYGSENSLLFKLIGNESLSVMLSGLIGIVLVIGILFIPILVIRQRKSVETTN